MVMVLAAGAGPGTAFAEGGDCAAPYQKALADVSVRHTAPLNQAIETLTSPDASLPGTWLFSSRTGRGRAGVGKSELATQNYIWRVVKAKGVLEEFDKQNGRFIFLVNRTREEVLNYVNQPVRAGLCSGGPEMMGFYDTNLEPMRKRMAEFQKAAKDARGWVARELKRLEQAEPKAATETSSTIPAPAVATRAKPAIDPASGYASMVDSLMRSYAPESADTVVAAPAVVAKLKAAAMQTGENMRRLIPVMRALETGVYAELAMEKFQVLDQRIAALINGVVAAHAAQCSCTH